MNDKRHNREITILPNTTFTGVDIDCLLVLCIDDFLLLLINIYI